MKPVWHLPKRSCKHRRCWWWPKCDNFLEHLTHHIQPCLVQDFTRKELKNSITTEGMILRLSNILSKENYLLSPFVFTKKRGGAEQRERKKLIEGMSTAKHRFIKTHGEDGWWRYNENETPINEGVFITPPVCGYGAQRVPSETGKRDGKGSLSNVNKNRKGTNTKHLCVQRTKRLEIWSNSVFVWGKTQSLGKYNTKHDKR